MVRQVPLTRGEVATVDDEDFEWAASYKWYANKGRCGSFYAARGAFVREPDGTRRQWTVQMHRELLIRLCGEPPEGHLADHEDGDTLNNTRGNLRWLPPRESNLNRRASNRGGSEYRGVYFRKDRQKWHARTKVDGKSVLGGNYDTEEEAAAAYNRLALQYHGEHAKLNVIKDKENA